MKIIQQIFEQSFEEAITSPLFQAKIIAMKLKKDGISLSQNKIDEIANHIQTAGISNLQIEFDDSELAEFNIPPDAKLTLDLSDTTDEIETLSEKLFENLPEVILDVAHDTAELILPTLRDQFHDMLTYETDQSNDFEARLHEIWGKPLDLLQIFLILARDVGNELNTEYLENMVTTNEQNYVFDAIINLHARACQVTGEILTLLKAGYADGADARWRTLHEINVITLFLEKYGHIDDVAERYLLHDAIESSKATTHYTKYSDRLNFEPMPEEEIEAVRIQRDSLVERFGTNFKYEYGWAAPVLGDKKRYEFNQIQEHVDFSHYKPYVHLASHNIHAYSKGLFFKHGLSDDEDHILLAGPSNYGLHGPGHRTVLSLMQITTTLLTLDSSIDHLVQIDVLGTLYREIHDAFFESHNNLLELME